MAACSRAGPSSAKMDSSYTPQKNQALTRRSRKCEGGTQEEGVRREIVNVVQELTHTPHQLKAKGRRNREASPNPVN